MTTPLIDVQHVSKKFCRELKRSLVYGMQDIASEFICLGNKSKLRKKEFWAVHDVSFQLYRGECLGLIGHNGAGKSTMLKMLNGLIKPDEGQITIRGNVCALIELGAGFNPILTGRENIYVNASVLGISKRETNEMFDQIVEFADMKEFIDTPVQNYSSGMKVRLGFAVAAQLQPDVLLIDEVLAVGDLAFRIKCYNKIEELLKNTAIVIVSHNMPALARMTSKCIVLNKGAAAFSGPSEDAISYYYSLVDEKKLSKHTTMDHSEATVGSIKLLNEKNIETDTFEYDRPLSLAFDITVPVQYRSFVVSVLFMNQGMEPIAQCDSKYNDVKLTNTGKSQHIELTVAHLPLKPGKYTLNITIYDDQRQRYLYWNHLAKSFFVRGNFIGSCNVQFQAEWNIQ